VKSSAVLREQLESTLGSHWEAVLSTDHEPAGETLRSAAGELPRGALTEILGPVSSGRTSLLYSLLATACSNRECCTLIDAGDAFDPASAARAGVRLSQVLWVRCGGNVEHALKAADLLTQAGGFGLVAIDLGDTPPKISHRIPLAVWFRLRHAVESTRTALVVAAQQTQAHSCSALKIQLRSRALWRGQLPGRLLDGFEVTAECIRKHLAKERRFTISR
jgi:recombination protein RecA